MPYEIYLVMRILHDKNKDSNYLFLTDTGNKLNSDSLDTFIKDINKEIKSPVKITLDGLAKYAVIRMFEKGMNPILIRQISGMKDVYLDYCQTVAWNNTKTRLNDYLNSNIRSINTYADFN